MKIANIMFGRGLGGIEQAFLDYNYALTMAGHEVLAITHPLALINPQISDGVTARSLNNFGSWDFLASMRLRKMLKEFAPHATISHGNRALHLTHKAKKYCGLHIGLSHNYSLKHFQKLDVVFAITKDLRETLISAGIPIARIARIPNMVHLPEAVVQKAEKPADQPIIIGTMGRMVAKKGFDHLIDAASRLSALSRQPFKILIGGDGDEKASLIARIKKHKLEDKVELIGWVDDKAAFFAQCDIFCLPSLHEPFGIVLLEAMAHGSAIVAYASEGPKEILTQHPEAGILVKNTDYGALAENLSRLIGNPAQRNFLAAQARLAVEQDYSIAIVSKKIDAALKQHVPT